MLSVWHVCELSGRGVAAAWSLKAWTALLLPETGRWKEKHRAEKQTLLKMDFVTFRNAIINMPAQIVRGGRRIVYRLLSWNTADRDGRHIRE